MRLFVLHPTRSTSRHQFTRMHFLKSAWYELITRVGSDGEDLMGTSTSGIKRSLFLAGLFCTYVVLPAKDERRQQLRRSWN